MNKRTYTKTNVKTLEKLGSLDMEWVRLIKEAKEIGLTIDDVKTFFHSESKSLIKE
ncbi:anti-repressor SinI family protein [Fervidibacillus halotolerans]|uniref:Anti-repressor SinI family protein n=1 Tax=Fervidibacillus halotolerans TaxID=2980027 RepID=A0A9E8M0S2_9BACI|nr:anti-repressor SinI family protein [Fervidibacillus halotolerans]WAA13315.1 anti-repressor SinI family protein [Fervidibacillus halotolerans]